MKLVFWVFLLIAPGCVTHTPMVEEAYDVEYTQLADDIDEERCERIGTLVGRPASAWSGSMMGANEARVDIKNQAALLEADIVLEKSVSWTSGFVTGVAYRCEENEASEETH